MSDIVSSKIVKTRKPCRCFFCAELYPKGTTMRGTVSVDGGEISYEHVCDVCDAYIRKYWHYGDECGYGEIKENDPEGWEEIKASLYNPIDKS
ncbi:MAG: hypothetical protein WC455_23440 [Dehalococcoidia bacterium]|jgi:hypothetical protein